MTDITTQDDADSAYDAELADFFGSEDGGEADPFELAADEDPQAPAAAADDGGTAAGDPDADPAEERSGPPKTVPYRRLQRVIGERNELRSQLAKLTAEESKLRASLSEHEGFRSAVADRYGRFRNPAAQLAHDADFMSQLEELAKSDNDVHGFYKKVIASMQASGAKPSAPKEEAASTPAPDPRLSKLFANHARTTINEVLTPLKLEDKYQRLIVNHILQNAKDPSEIDAGVVKTLARKFIADSGFTLDEMRRATDSPVKATKPKTTGVGGAAPAQRTAAKDQPAKKKFESRSEYLEHRAKVVDDLIAGLMES